MAIALRGKVRAINSSAATSIASGTFNVAPVSGDAVVVCVLQFGGSDPTNVVDNVAGSPNTYVRVTNAATNNNGVRCNMYYCLGVTTGAGFALTANWGASVDEQFISALALSGVATSSALDLSLANPQTSPGTAANAVTTGAMGTPSTDGQVVVAMTGVDLWPDTISAGSTFSVLDAYTFGQPYVVEYCIQTTATAVAGTFTTDNTAGSWATGAASFKPPPAASGVPVDDDDLYALQISQGSQWSVSQW